MTLARVVRSRVEALVSLAERIVDASTVPLIVLAVVALAAAGEWEASVRRRATEELHRTSS